MEILLWYYAYGKPKESITVDMTKEVNHYHIYIPSNGRTPDPQTQIIDGASDGAYKPAPNMTGANGHDEHPVFLPTNGRADQG